MVNLPLPQHGRFLAAPIVALLILAGVTLFFVDRLIQHNALSHAYTTLTNDLFYAKEKAINLKRTVTLCSKREDNNNCGNQAPGTWNNNRLIFIDLNKNKKIDNPEFCKPLPTFKRECILHKREHVDHSLQFTTQPNIESINFRPDGTLAQQSEAIHINICAQRNLSYGKGIQITVELSGHISTNRTFDCAQN